MSKPLKSLIDRSFHIVDRLGQTVMTSTLPGLNIALQDAAESYRMPMIATAKAHQAEQSETAKLERLIIEIKRFINRLDGAKTERLLSDVVTR